MTGPHSTFVARTQLGGGSGRLVRSGGVCLYVPPPINSSAIEFIGIVQASGHQMREGSLVSLIGDFVLEHADVPPFVFVSWGEDHGDIHLLVRGDVSIDTDIASVPSLSGVGSATWVEHQVRRTPERAVLRCGEPADVDADTELRDGVVHAGGFVLELDRVPPPEPHIADLSSSPPTTTLPDTPEPNVARMTASTSPTAESAPSQGLAALRAASGRTPTEPARTDSTRAADASSAAPPVPRPTPSSGLASADSFGSSSEVLSRSSSEILPGSPEEADPAGTSTSGAPPFPGGTGRDGSTRLPSDATTEGNNPDIAGSSPTPRLNSSLPTSPPTFPGEEPIDDDPEATLSPAHVAPEPSAAPHRLVQATFCSEHHANPPHRIECRICGSALDSGQTTTVEQPVLGLAELPNGAIVPIDSPILLGRNPTTDAARLETDCRLVPLDVSSSVSRTHLLIRAEGWSITATDCGSQGGSALVPDGTDDPIELAAWVPHELNGGDQLYLGGLTTVRILDVPG